MKRITTTFLTLSALILAPALYGADTDTAASATGCPTGGACPMTAAASASAADCDKPCCAKTDAGLTQVKYQVDALACGDCEAKVTQTLAALKGVGTAQACSKEKLVQVAYNAKLLKDKDIIAAIQKAGFKVDAETVELKVAGMKCEACSGKVSQTLAQMKGVKEQKVCHQSGNAIVKFDPATVSREKLLAAIGDSGFKVVP